MRLPMRRSDEGFTLLELVVAMAIAGVLMALAIPSWRSYQNAHDYLGSVRETVSFLREAQSHAVAEETSYRVDFATGGRTLTMLRYNGSDYVSLKTATLPGTAAAFASPSFTTRTGAASSSAFFYARGTASDGTVVLTRLAGSGRTHTVDVEGLTGRVDYDR